MTSHEGSPPRVELCVGEVNVLDSKGFATGETRCEEVGNLWDHFKSMAVATLVTAKCEFGTSCPTLEQFQEAYKKHTGNALRDDAVEHGFRNEVAMLEEVRDLRVVRKDGTIYVTKRPAVAETPQATLCTRGPGPGPGPMKILGTRARAEARARVGPGFWISTR